MKRARSLTRLGLCLLVALPGLGHGQNVSPVLLPDHPLGEHDIPDTENLSDASRPAPGQPIRILFLYTADAIAASDDPLAAVLNAVSEINESFDRSDIPVAAEIAHVFMSDERESGNLWQDLKSLKNLVDGAFDDVPALRNRYSADVVMLITEKADGCGVAFQHAASENAYAVVQRTCMERNITAAHELGHILGADHQRELTLNSRYAYGHGYQNIAEGVRTIMAFPCPKWDCQRISVWSGPGDGDWLGNDEVSNNRRVVSEHAAIVAGFR